MGKGKGRKGKVSGSRDANRLLADNRQARHQYEIIQTLEVGVELLGTEVKSVRAGKANLRNGFCLIHHGEMQLHNMHISPHTHASAYFNHDPLRVRRLLARRREIEKLRVALEQKGLTLVPLNLHLKGSWIKLTLGLARGRKLHDKRQQERRRQDAKEVRSALKRL